jgi:outer membrane protein assembly factor BamB
VLALAAPVQAQVVGWRGDGAGVFEGPSPSIDWPAKGEPAYLWKTPMPGPSCSTPVVVGGRVFTLSDEGYTLICCDLATGKILWQHSNEQWEHMPAEQAERGKKLLAEDRAHVTAMRDWEKRYRVLMDELKNDVNKSGFKSAQKVFADCRDAQEAELPSDAALRKRYVELLQDGRAQSFGVSLDYVTILRKESKPGSDLWNRTETLAQEFGEWWGSSVKSRDETSGRTFATPVCDVSGGGVYASFANNVVACYTLDGKRVWSVWDHKPMGKSARGPGGCREFYYIASPVLVEDMVVVAGGENRLRAYDCKTGAKRWEAEYKYPTQYTCGTPAVARVGETAVIVGANGMVYRAADGHVLITDLPMCDKGASPVAKGDVALITTDTRTQQPHKGLSAVKLVANGADGLTWTVLWNVPDAAEDARGPAWAGDLVYHLRPLAKRMTLAVYEAATGKVIVEADQPVMGWPSVSVAGDHVLLRGNSENIWAFKAGRTPTFVAETRVPLDAMKLSHGTYTSPGFGVGKIVLRGTDTLYCLGR